VFVVAWIAIVCGCREASRKSNCYRTQNAIVCADDDNDAGAKKNDLPSDAGVIRFLED